MKIGKEQIKNREVIGQLAGKPVHLIESIGGLHLIVMAKSGTIKTLGAGPHRAIAMHVAELKEPDIQWAEYLTKSEDSKCPLCRQKDHPNYCLCLLRQADEK